MVEIPRGFVFHRPGVWEPRTLIVSGTEPRIETASMSCPGCGCPAELADHAIDAVGRVTPSVVCPKACGFHALVTLVGWSDR